MDYIGMVGVGFGFLLVGISLKKDKKKNGLAFVIAGITVLFMGLIAFFLRLN